MCQLKVTQFWLTPAAVCLGLYESFVAEILTIIIYLHGLAKNGVSS
jgi:hypothetical protein